MYGLTEAINYAKRGWYIVPDHSVVQGGKCTCKDLFCKVQGKHPRIERESPNAHIRRSGSRDINQITQWWNTWPDSNIAIVCGKPSNLVAVDIDPRNGGFDSLSMLEAKYGKLSNSLTSKSGGGGRHILFLHPQTELVRNRIGLFPGIDIKADEGRIVAPPSRHVSGKTYEWLYTDKEPILPLPKWLLYIIQNQKGTGTWQYMRRNRS